MNKKQLIILTTVSVIALAAASLIYETIPSFANTPAQTELSEEKEGRAGAQGHEQEADGHGDERGEAEKGITIDRQSAIDMNIDIDEAGPGTVHVSIPATGKIVLNRNATAEVKARFQGVVRSVAKTQGERVGAGDTLATVESNDSLQVYPVKAPISGVVLERNTNIGHIAGEEPLFTIADLSKLWVELHVFPKDMAIVNEGQKIRLQAVGTDLTAHSTITALLPVTDATSQTVVARAKIDNVDGKWRPGMSIHGDIFTEEKTVPVAVKMAAIQRIEGKPVIFVENQGAFEARNIALGVQDGETAEVTDGLKAGEKYVANNSFVLKAEAGKAGAEHAD